MDVVSPARSLRALGAAPFVGALALTAFVVGAASDGAYAETVWYPTGLFVLGLVAVAVLGGVTRRPSPAAGAALAALALFTAWSFLSIAWADEPAAAWTGANRTLLYLAVYGLFAVLPWRPGDALWALAAWGGAVTALGLGFFAAAAGAARPGDYFIQGRFSEPAGYQNANCALFLMALWPLLGAASRRGAPAWARALALAGAGVALELAVLTQSRGSVVAAPVVAIAFVALSPARLRALLSLAVASAAAAATLPWLADVYPAVRERTGEDAALGGALTALVVSAVALLAAGVLLAAADRRWEPSRRVTSALSRALLGIAAALVLAGAVAGALSHPVARVQHAWHEFKVDRPPSRGSNLARGLASNRYDIWRVAVQEWRRRPLEGIGADNFAVPYLRERRSIEEPLYPHSVELRTLSQLGIVGAALLAVFLGAALVPALRRGRGPAAGAAAAAGLGVAGYWLVHGSEDWFWEVAGISAPAFAALAVAGATAAGERPALVPRGFARVPAGALLAVLLAAAAASFTFPWLAAKEVATASGSWRADRAGAFARLDRARRLNPLSEEADLFAGAIASRLGDHARMRAAFTRAVERNPHAWYAYFELAVAESQLGRPAAARRRLAEAARLDPLEPAIGIARDALGRGETLDPRLFDKIFDARARAVGD